jgi:hypothetical protein
MGFETSVPSENSVPQLRVFLLEWLQGGVNFGGEHCRCHNMPPFFFYSFSAEGAQFQKKNIRQTKSLLLKRKNCVRSSDYTASNYKMINE